MHLVLVRWAEQRAEDKDQLHLVHWWCDVSWCVLHSECVLGFCLLLKAEQRHLNNHCSFSPLLVTQSVGQVICTPMLHCTCRHGKQSVVFMSWSWSTAGTSCRAVQLIANMATWNNFAFDNICPTVTGHVDQHWFHWGLSFLFPSNSYFCCLFSMFSSVINRQSSSSDPTRALVL